MNLSTLRRPFDLEQLQDELALRSARWRTVGFVPSTGSTNADGAIAAAGGAAEGWALMADAQEQGRGRLDRQWKSPLYGGIALSIVVRPTVPVERWSWLPLLVGVAVVDALREVSGVPAALKWPNDVVVDGPDHGGGPGPRKLGGILVERVPMDVPVLVAGIGLNVLLDQDELPTPTATSLALEAAAAGSLPIPARELLVAGILDHLERRLGHWYAAAGDAKESGLSADYLSRCCTVGRQVRLALPAGDVSGVALGVDEIGRIQLATGTEVLAYGAGDVIHLRAQ
jgi:BirA family biotin operon repressor/biotin-[acetyl-CoA-carboxylase] ligase